VRERGDKGIFQRTEGRKKMFGVGEGFRTVIIDVLPVPSEKGKGKE